MPGLIQMIQSILVRMTNLGAIILIILAWTDDNHEVQAVGMSDLAFTLSIIAGTALAQWFYRWIFGALGRHSRRSGQHS